MKNNVIFLPNLLRLSPVMLCVSLYILWLFLMTMPAGPLYAQETEVPPAPAVEPAPTDTSVIKAKPAEPEAAEPVTEPVILSEETAKPAGRSAHAIGFGFSSATFTMTIKSDTALNSSESLDGYNGIYFHYHAVKPDAKIYFSPNIVYSYSTKGITSAGAHLDSFRRYIFFAGNVGFNLNSLLANPLLIEVFLEGGLGPLVLEDGVKQGESNWHYLLGAMDLLLGGRYWLSPDFGAEATFRFINCFVDSGLDGEDTEEFLTFNDYKFGLGIVVRP